MSCIRAAISADLSRIAEIVVFNYRLNFYPIFRSDEFYFGELTVPNMIAQYEADSTFLSHTLVYDDGVVKGFLRYDGDEVKQLFVEPVLHGQGIGAELLEYAIRKLHVDRLWALEKNTRAIAFYQRHGFVVTDARKFEEDTDEYLIQLVRKKRQSPMQITTARLLVRAICAEDWQAVRAIWQDFSASPYAQYDKPHVTDPDDVRTRIARWAEFTAAGMEHMFFVACVDNEVIGYIAFNIREKGYEIGYCFHSKHHGKGYAKEALLALFVHLRGLGITHFSAGTALNNTPSVKLLTGLGFQLAGTEKVSFCKDADGQDIVFDGGVFELELN